VLAPARLVKFSSVHSWRQTVKTEIGFLARFDTCAFIKDTLEESVTIPGCDFVNYKPFCLQCDLQMSFDSADCAKYISLCHMSRT